MFSRNDVSTWVTPNYTLPCLAVTNTWYLNYTRDFNITKIDGNVRRIGVYLRSADLEITLSLSPVIWPEERVEFQTGNNALEPGVREISFKA